jgi:hypothetical protein
MRRLLLAAVVLSAACAAPLPCTQALCPSHQDGSYRVSGWNKTVTVAPGQPPIPIVSDSSVEVLDGKVEFVNRRAVVRADAGASFLFSVSSDPAHVPSIVVSSGEVSVALSSTSAPSPVAPGASYLFPVPKK